jgi:hypothetical protein
VLTALLALAAFVAGLTGSWSPCGFSMVSTLGPTGHAGGRGTTLAACGAFVPGALAGGVVTFVSLSALGSLLGGGTVALLAGAAVAGAAAVAEATGRRIVPQVRRQVPEHWRRALPLPVAAAGYGVLLGLGFTTFVLTFAVPALAGVALAIGEPAAGLAAGLAFGTGRALPVVLLAPLADAPAGMRATELMAERPSILRGFRAADAAALAAVALALGAEGATAQTVAPAPARPFLSPATSPSVAGDELAWKVPGGPGVIRTGAGERLVDARQLAIGGPNMAVVLNGEVRVNDRATNAEVARIPAAAATALAVSARWVAWRELGDRIVVQPLPAGPRQVVATGPEETLGRPALDGDRVVYHYAGARVSRIDEIDLLAGAFTVLRRSTRTSLTNPSLLGEQLLYVETTPWSQSLRLGGRLEGGRAIIRIAPAIVADKGYSTDHGPHRRVRQPVRPAPEGPRGTTTTLWTTALAADAAYVTRVRQRAGTTAADVLRFAR